MQEAYEGSTLRSWLSRSLLPWLSSMCSSSWSESKWSSMARLEAPVMNTSRCAPATSASSTAYWMSGLSTTGSISLGLALVAGRKRVPRPATGNTAVRITDLDVDLIAISPCPQLPSSRGPYRALGALRPLEDVGTQAVPGVTLGAAPVPAHAVEPAIVTLVASARFADARQQCTERACLGERVDARAQLRADSGQLRHVLRRHRGRQQPRQLSWAHATVLPQAPAELVQHVAAVRLAGNGEHCRDDLEREPRGRLERVQVKRQRAGGIARLLRDARREHVGTRQLRLVRARLAQQCAGTGAVALQQGVLGELTQVVRGDTRAFLLHRLRQLVKDLERPGPVTLCLVDALEVLERRIAVLARGGELFQHPLGAIHETGTLVVECQCERRLVGERSAPVFAQPRVNGDRAVDLSAPPEQAAESELDLGGIPVGFRHAREDLGRMVETVVDEVIEPDVIIAGQAHRAGYAVTAAEKPGCQPHEDEGQRQEQWRQLEHDCRR